MKFKIGDPVRVAVSSEEKRYGVIDDIHESDRGWAATVKFKSPLPDGKTEANEYLRNLEAA